MPRGIFPNAYLHHPNITKPIEDIYAEIDAFTYEVFEEETSLHDSIDFVVLLPPLKYQGRFIKGIFFSNGVDYLNKRFPQLKLAFTSIAYSLFTSYPWAKSADAYMTCYRNPRRETWFRQQHPNRRRKALIPLQDADFTNEYLIAPVPVANKDIDVLCISRLHEQKNLPMIARGLKIYRSKYPDERIRMTLITGNKCGYSSNCLSEHARRQWAQLEKILGTIENYIDLVPYVDHYAKLPEYYSRSRALVLGSLIEGKSRCINEALSCDVPVICFREHNQFAREGHPIFPEDSGLYASFDAESLADTVHTVLQYPESFSPRLAYLKHNGRKNFINNCLDAIPYYGRVLPDFVAGHHFQNVWLDIAIQNNYQMGLHEFVYGQRRGVPVGSGMQNIEKAVQFYCERFHV